MLQVQSYFVGRREQAPARDTKVRKGSGPERGFVTTIIMPFSHAIVGGGKIGYTDTEGVTADNNVFMAAAKQMWSEAGSGVFESKSIAW